MVLAAVDHLGLDLMLKKFEEMTVSIENMAHKLSVDSKQL